MDFVGRQGATYRNRHARLAAQCGSDRCGARYGRNRRHIVRRKRDALGLDGAQASAIFDVGCDVRADLIDGHCAGGGYANASHSASCCGHGPGQYDGVDVLVARRAQRKTLFGIDLGPVDVGQDLRSIVSICLNGPNVVERDCRPNRHSDASLATGTDRCRNGSHDRRNRCVTYRIQFDFAWSRKRAVLNISVGFGVDHVLSKGSRAADCDAGRSTKGSCNRCCTGSRTDRRVGKFPSQSI